MPTAMAASMPRRIGDDHGFHVLQDVSADLSQHLFRFSAQHLAQLCGTVRDGDGLCTPCGQQELLLQDRRVGGDLGVVQHHTFSFVQLLFYQTRRCARQAG